MLHAPNPSWLWLLSTAIQFLQIIGLLRSVNLNMSLIITPRCVALCWSWRKCKSYQYTEGTFTLALEIRYQDASYTGTLKCTKCKRDKWKRFLEECDFNCFHSRTNFNDAATIPIWDIYILLVLVNLSWSRLLWRVTSGFSLYRNQGCIFCLQQVDYHPGLHLNEMDVIFIRIEVQKKRWMETRYINKEKHVYQQIILKDHFWLTN